MTSKADGQRADRTTIDVPAERRRRSRLRIVVINLEESAERRASICSQLTQLDLAFALFEAVDASRGFSSFAAYDERKYLSNTGRRASPQEAACFASHVCLWKRCVASGEPMVILEDDAEVLPCFLAALARNRDAHSGLRIHSVCRSTAPRGTLERRSSKKRVPFNVHYFASCPFGAMAYAISPASRGGVHREKRRPRRTR